MNKTNIHNQNKNKNSKIFVASIAIVVALTLFVSPMLNVDDALATYNKKNKAKQSIEKRSVRWNNLSIMQQPSFPTQKNQSQSSSQNSQVVSGADTIGSGNNINVQSQENTGSNAAAQQ